MAYYISKRDISSSDDSTEFLSNFHYIWTVESEKVPEHNMPQEHMPELISHTSGDITNPGRSFSVC